jgi:hypothetical protein
MHPNTLSAVVSEGSAFLLMFFVILFQVWCIVWLVSKMFSSLWSSPAIAQTTQIPKATRFRTASKTPTAPSAPRKAVQSRRRVPKEGIWRISLFSNDRSRPLPSLRRRSGSHMYWDTLHGQMEMMGYTNNDETVYFEPSLAMVQEGVEEEEDVSEVEESVAPLRTAQITGGPVKRRKLNDGGYVVVFGLDPVETRTTDKGEDTDDGFSCMATEEEDMGDVQGTVLPEPMSEQRERPIDVRGSVPLRRSPRLEAKRAMEPVSHSGLGSLFLNGQRRSYRLFQQKRVVYVF